MLSHSKGLPVHSAVEQSALVLGCGEDKEFQKCEAHKVERESHKKRGKDVAKQVPDAQVGRGPPGQCLCTQVSVLPFPAGVTAEVHLEGNGLGTKCSEISRVN